MSIKTASEALEAMLNQDDFRHRAAWEQFFLLLREMANAVADGDTHQVKVISGKVSGFTRLRLAAARGWMTDDIMRELDIVPTQTLGNRITKLAFDRGLTISTANKSWALPGRTAATKLAPEGYRKIEDNMPMLREYSKLYDRHKVRLQAKVATFIAEARKVRKREKTEAAGESVKPKKMPRGQAELFI